MNAPFATSASSSAFLRTLRRDVGQALHAEVEITLQVAVCMAGGMTRREIVTTLGVPEHEVRMCLTRLERVANEWRQQ